MIKLNIILGIGYEFICIKTDIKLHDSVRDSLDLILIHHLNKPVVYPALPYTGRSAVRALLVDDARRHPEIVHAVFL